VNLLYTYYIQLNFDSSKSWGPFYKSELPEVRIKFALRAILTCKNSPHNNNMSSKWQETKHRVSECVRAIRYSNYPSSSYRDSTVHTRFFSSIYMSVDILMTTYMGYTLSSYSSGCRLFDIHHRLRCKKYPVTK